MSQMPARRSSLRASEVTHLRIPDNGRILGCSDRRGDDDVDIVLRSNGEVEVAYRNPVGSC